MIILQKMQRFFNEKAEILAGYKLIEKIALSNGGIIFGGYLRDEILRDEAIERYNSNFLDDNFWSSEFSKDTVDRLLIPSDIDISFKTQESFNNFENIINHITYFTEIAKIQEDNNRSYKCTQLIIKSVIGKSFLRDGIELIFYVDAIVNERTPPFIQTDALCNCLIKDLAGLRISENNGFVDINKCTPYNLSKLTFKVINSIVKKETFMVMQITNKTSAENALKRILKLLNKGFKIKNVDWLKELTEKDKCFHCVEEGATHSIKCSKFHLKCLEDAFNTVIKYDRGNGNFYFVNYCREKCYIEFSYDLEKL